MAIPEDTEAVGPITDQHGGDEGDDQQNGPKRRKNNTSMDLNQIWKLYNDSVEINGVSLSMLVRTKQNDREAGCKQSTSTHWLKKIMKMYCRRANLGFKNIDHINVVCDASRHSVYDCLVSVFYSRHNDIAAYAPTQALRSSKIVHPGEIVCDSEVEKLLAEGSRTRLSGYRLLQAISHQVQLVSDFKLSLTNFLVSDDMEFALQPVASDVTRVVTGTFVRHVKKNGGDDGEVAPAANLLTLAKMPILVIGMDQGSSGMGAASYLCDNGSSMVHFYWDPYHRLIRDLKMAATSCPANVNVQIQQGLLCGSYLFSLNYKPFGKAGFHDDKRALLNAFMQTETQDKSVKMFQVNLVCFKKAHSCIVSHS